MESLHPWGWWNAAVGVRHSQGLEHAGNGGGEPFSDLLGGALPRALGLVGREVATTRAGSDRERVAVHAARSSLVPRRARVRAGGAAPHPAGTSPPAAPGGRWASTTPLTSPRGSLGRTSRASASHA